MDAEGHLSALRRHGVRVDGVLYDPDANLRFSAATLARHGLPGFAHPLPAGRRPVHDAGLLGAALESLLGAQGAACAQRFGTI